MRDPKIVIRHDPIALEVIVEVSPPPSGVGHDQSFAIAAQARAYAAKLAGSTGWAAVDLTNFDTRGAPAAA